MRFFEAPLPPGSPAPDFSLPDQDGNLVTLSALHGRNVVLIFYPGDGTPVCRKQLCEFRDSWEAARASETVVLAINPQSASSHAAFRARHRLPFPLLVDEGGRVARLYRAGGWWVKRTVYLVGRSGTIRYAKRGTPPPAEVLAAAEPGG